MRLRQRQLPVIALLAALIALGGAPAISLAANPTVEAITEGVYAMHRWSPEEVAVVTSNAVTFLNSSTTVNHGIVWTSQITPTCDNTVPVGVGNFAKNWSGACTFSQAGEYTYYCSYHGPSMHGVIFVNASGAFPPTATTGTATQVSENGATLHGTVNPKGQPTSYYFNYGLTSSYGQKTAELPAGTDNFAHAESAAISGLAAGTVYHFQLVATYASGASLIRSTDQTFTTSSSPGAPTASTGEASAIGETSATLNGAVNPSGQETTYFFNYGTSNSYGHTTPVAILGADSANHMVSAALTGLAPGTVYHFELIAHNASGNTPGLDRTFTTAPPPPPPTETTTTSTTTTTPPPILSGGTTPPAPSFPTNLATSGSPLAGSASTAIKVAGAQHGSSVHGSLDIAPAGAGARLEVDLLAASAALTRKHTKQVRIGRFLRAALVAGKLSFSVSLNAQAKRVLHRRHRLPVIVQITLSPLHGVPITAMRSVTLRG
ncbi:MAG TPA: plastocyanin/azurin family copper-binding protein [Solirubrobacteraceae bacterium]|nr:plastocyanin/azurin family copper-binding protein [Solirubrobacteraceae bacterium]